MVKTSRIVLLIVSLFHILQPPWLTMQKDKISHIKDEKMQRLGIKRPESFQKLVKTRFYVCCYDIIEILLHAAG